VRRRRHKAGAESRMTQEKYARLDKTLGRDWGVWDLSKQAQELLIV
jgi:hypothetical protein